MIVLRYKSSFDIIKSEKYGKRRSSLGATPFSFKPIISTTKLL